MQTCRRNAGSKQEVTRVGMQDVYFIRKQNTYSMIHVEKNISDLICSAEQNDV